MHICKADSCMTCAVYLHLCSFSEHNYLNATALLLELQDLRHFAEHTQTLHFISKHYPPSHSVHPLLMPPLMSSLTTFKLWAEV